MFGRERRSSEQHGTATQGLSALIAGPTAALSRGRQWVVDRRPPIGNTEQSLSITNAGKTCMTIDGNNSHPQRLPQRMWLRCFSTASRRRRIRTLSVILLPANGSRRPGGKPRIASRRWRPDCWRWASRPSSESVSRRARDTSGSWLIWRSCVPGPPPPPCIPAPTPATPPTSWPTRNAASCSPRTPGSWRS